MSSRLGIAGIVLLAAFGLAACGGGGGSGTADTMPEPPPPTQAELDAMEIARLQGQIDALRMQLGLEADGDLSQSITDLMAERDGLQKQIDDAAEAEEAARMEAERMAAEAERMAAEAAAAAMAVTAAKLYAGISAPGGTGADTRTAVYAAGGNIEVTIGTAGAVGLSADDDATVAARHGWYGQMFTAAPTDGGTYEAHVYSHVEDPEVTEGQAFNAAYTLNADTGETGDVTGLTDHATGRVASPSFDQSAGTKAFIPGTNDIRIMVSGSYRGVHGTYYCTPSDRAVGCTAAVAAMGFTLGGGTWTFKPTNPEQKFMDTSAPDADYASYGWWLHKSEDGSTYTASAFAANRGTVDAATDITALQGSARYTGGAAGKYALSSTTGGTNDAGHFTADVTLEANFTTDMISGTVDNFTGADGEARNWSVTLNETDVGDTGAIDGQDDASAEVGTVWTIDGTAGAKSGQWRGNLYENGDDGVPTIATGTFYTEFGRDGKMVGGFGANKQ